MTIKGPFGGATISSPEFAKLGKDSANLIRVGVIGYGYWGPNIVRNVQSLENAQVVAICDKNSSALRRAARLYPTIHLTTEFADVLQSPDIDVVAVVTPVWTHYEIAQARPSKTASTCSSRSRSRRPRSRRKSSSSWPIART